MAVRTLPQVVLSHKLPARQRPYHSITLTPRETRTVGEFLDSADTLLSAAWTATGVIAAAMEIILNTADNADDPEMESSLLSGDLLAAADTLELLKSRLHDVASHTELAEEGIPQKLWPREGGENA